jgi:hypothetical protein
MAKADEAAGCAIEVGRDGRVRLALVDGAGRVMAYSVLTAAQVGQLIQGLQQALPHMPPAGSS